MAKNSDGTFLRVLVRVPKASMPELYAELELLSGKARAERLRVLAMMVVVMPGRRVVDASRLAAVPDAPRVDPDLDKRLTGAQAAAAKLLGAARRTGT